MCSVLLLSRVTFSSKYFYTQTALKKCQRSYPNSLYLITNISNNFPWEKIVFDEDFFPKLSDSSFLQNWLEKLKRDYKNKETFQKRFHKSWTYLHGKELKNLKAMIICCFLFTTLGARKLCRQLTINYDNNLKDISHFKFFCFLLFLAM